MSWAHELLPRIMETLFAVTMRIKQMQAPSTLVIMTEINHMVLKVRLCLGCSAIKQPLLHPSQQARWLTAIIWMPTQAQTLFGITLTLISCQCFPLLRFRNLLTHFTMTVCEFTPKWCLCIPQIMSKSCQVCLCTSNTSSGNASFAHKPRSTQHASREGRSSKVKDCHWVQFGLYGHLIGASFAYQPWYTWCPGVS